MRLTTTGDRRPVAVGADGTGGSTGALAHAVTEAGRRGVGLRVVHVAPDIMASVPYVPESIPTDVTSAARRVLDGAVAAVRDVDPDVPVWPVLRQGGRVPALVEATADVQLMVLGRESVHGLDRLLFGTTTARVAAHATAPVRVVPAGWVERTGPVVLGVGAPHGIADQVCEALELSATRGGRVVVVHAVHLPSPYAETVDGWSALDDWLRSARAELEESVEAVRRDQPHARVDVRVDYGDPAQALLTAAAEVDASLVVLHRRRRVTGRTWSLGRTLTHLAAQCPVVVHVASLPRSEHD